MSDTGVIHDIGYQRYTGPRLNRAYRARSLYTFGLRTAFGIGRGAKAKIFPWFVVGTVAIVAVVVMAVRSLSGEAELSYVRFPDTLSLLVILFCATAAPELVSRDLRSGVLPLYFSRPLSRVDYPVAKLAALTSAIWLILAGGQALMFVGAVFSVSGPGAVWDEALDLIPGLLYSGITALLVASLSLLVASLASRRAVAAGMIVAAFLITAPVYGVIIGVGGETGQKVAGIVSPTTLLIGVAQWFWPEDSGPPTAPYGPLYGAVAVALIAGCILLLLARYRRVAR